MEDPKQIARWFETGTLGSFSMSLMQLIQKADTLNKAKLKLIYPEYVEAEKIWFNGEY